MFMPSKAALFPGIWSLMSPLPSPTFLSDVSRGITMAFSVLSHIPILFFVLISRQEGKTAHMRTVKLQPLTRKLEIDFFQCYDIQKIFKILCSLSEKGLRLIRLFKYRVTFYSRYEITNSEIFQNVFPLNTSTTPEKGGKFCT